jgi:hypothetical protein
MISMQTYEFIFECQLCAKQVPAHVTSPDVFTKDELNRMEFQLTCTDNKCGWTATRTGAEAVKIVAALKAVSVCE